MNQENVTLRIALVGYWPEIWRTFRVPISITLPSLHTVVQSVMGWTNRHLYQFSSDYHDFSAGEEQEERRCDALTLSRFVRLPGDELEYEYDFGDAWRHRIVATEFTQGALDKAVCLAGAGRCPPEDVGGVVGYREFLTGRPSSFDCEKFDADEVNAVLELCALERRVESIGDAGNAQPVG